MNFPLKVLIVDDSKIICDRITAQLKEIPKTGSIYRGYNFMEALQLLKAHSPDIAILDINLPDKTGIELLRTIKENQLAVKMVIMMTEEASELHREKCLQLGADYFLNKFTDFEMISEIIENISK